MHRKGFFSLIREGGEKLKAVASKTLDCQTLIDDSDYGCSDINSPIIEVVPLPTLISGERAKDLDDPSVLVIACTSYFERYARYSSPTFLLLDFDDITNSKRLRAFKPEHARRIATLIEESSRQGGGIKRIIASCDGGVSRSAAVAAALMQRFGQDDEHAIWLNPNYGPNRLVYEVLCEGLGVEMERAVVDEKVRRSGQAMRARIHHQN